MTAVLPDSLGHFGRFGGRFMPEALIAPLEELTTAWREAMADSVRSRSREQVARYMDLSLRD